MKVLLVCKLADNTMKENVLRPLLGCNNINRIYVLRDSSSAFTNDRVSYITLSKESHNKCRHFFKISKGIKCIRKNNIEAIIGVLNTPHGYIGRMIGLLTRTPYIHMTIAGHREFWMHGSLMEKINLRFLGSGKAITVTGYETKQYLERKGIDKSKIFILPNLPDERFNSVISHENRRYDIVSFSRIDLNKNVILLIKALALLKNDFPNIKVAIAGDGDELENIKREAANHRVDKIIDFLGYINGFENKVKVLTDSSIFISCSKGEGFPVSLIEAMCCGCVPIVSNVGDIADVIRDGENGYLFNDTDDESEFTNKLRLVLQNKEHASALRQKAMEIKETISVRSNSKIWDNIFESVLKK